MKKILCAVLAVLLSLCMIFAVTACTNGTDTGTVPGDDTTQGDTDTPGGSEDDIPGGNEDDTSGGNEDNTPGGSEDNTPGGNEDDTPGGNEDDKPGGNEDNTPGGSEDNTPGGNEDDTPGGSEDDKPGGDEDNTPGGNEDNTPGGSEDNTPGGNEDDTPGGSEDNTPGGDEDDPSEDESAAFTDKLDRVLGTLMRQEYIAIDMNATVLEIGGEGNMPYTAGGKFKLARNETYGYDIFYSLMSDGQPEGSGMIVDGMEYSETTVDGETLYYPSSLDYSQTWIMKIIPALFSSYNLFRIYDSLISFAGLDAVEGIEMTASDGEIAFSMVLEETRQSILAWVDSLKEQSLDELSTIVEELFDEDITVEDFIAKYDSVLSPHGLRIEDILTDEYIASILIVIGTFPYDAMDRIYSDTANYIYELLSENAGEQVGNILSEPKDGESAYTYLMRVFGQFKLTGVMDMFTGETGEGARTFAELKESFAAAAEECGSLYDFIDLMVYQSQNTHIEDIIGQSLRAVAFGDSFLEVTINLDESGRISQASYVLDGMSYDADDTDEYEIEQSGIYSESKLIFSYDAYTIEAPSEDMLVPALGEAQIDEEEGTIFIPVKWNSMQPGDMDFVNLISFEAFSKDGDYVGSGEFEMPVITTEQNADGILIDLTAEWQELRLMIGDKLGDDSDDAAWLYELNLFMRPDAKCTYYPYPTSGVPIALGEYGMYCRAEGDKITLEEFYYWA